jgi:hypothetical protein
MPDKRLWWKKNLEEWESNPRDLRPLLKSRERKS